MRSYKQVPKKLVTDVNVTLGSPGTVSKILWHFTGGPMWNLAKGRQHEIPKPAKEAYQNLKSILKDREIRLGNYRNVVRVVVPKLRKYNSQRKRVDTLVNFAIDIESSPVCCLADIPAPHLRYHSYRYGKFAIGFRRESVIDHGFNPVFYTLEDTPIIRSIYEGFSSLDSVDPLDIANAVGDMEASDIEDDEMNLDFISSETDILQSTLGQARQSLQDFVAFVKTFSRTEFATIYCEREWRSTKPYRFTVDDVAMIVLPNEVNSHRYFAELANYSMKSLELPRRIPIIPWEDLVEQ